VTDFLFGKNNGLDWDAACRILLIPIYLMSDQGLTSHVATTWTFFKCKQFDDFEGRPQQNSTVVEHHHDDDHDEPQTNQSHVGNCLAVVERSNCAISIRLYSDTAESESRQIEEQSPPVQTSTTTQNHFTYLYYYRQPYPYATIFGTEQQ
jgi:hypothetical protein